MLALDLREWEVILRVSHRQTANKKIESTLTHRNIKDLFIIFQVVEWKSHKHKHTHTNIRNFLLSYCKTLQINQIHTNTNKPTRKIKWFLITYTTSRSFIIITITLSLFVTVKCIGYIYKRYVSVVVINKLIISKV